jgi:hypothetical protein
MPEVSQDIHGTRYLVIYLMTPLILVIDWTIFFGLLVSPKFLE